MKNGEFLQLSGGGLQALDSLTADLGLTKSEFQAGEAKIPAYRAFYLDSLSGDGRMKLFQRDEAYGMMVRWRGIISAGSWQMIWDWEKRCR